MGSVDSCPSALNHAGKTAQAISLLHHLQTNAVGCLPPPREARAGADATKVVLRLKVARPTPPSVAAEDTSSAPAVVGIQSRAAPPTVSLARRRGPFLVIAPLSTLGHWARELNAWTVGGAAAVRQSLLPPAEGGVGALPPSSEAALLQRFPARVLAGMPMNALLYHGPGPARAVMREHEWAFEDAATGVRLGQPLPAAPAALLHRVNDAQAALFGPGADAVRWYPCYKFDVLLTTYETVMQDAAHLSGIPWAAIVIDEAHR